MTDNAVPIESIVIRRRTQVTPNTIPIFLGAAPTPLFLDTRGHLHLNSNFFFFFWVCPRVPSQRSLFFISLVGAPRLEGISLVEAGTRHDTRTRVRSRIRIVQSAYSYFR
jgi:hypothetical protein